MLRTPTLYDLGPKQSANYVPSFVNYMHLDNQNFYSLFFLFIFHSPTLLAQRVFWRCWSCRVEMALNCWWAGPWMARFECGAEAAASQLLRVRFRIAKWPLRALFFLFYVKRNSDNYINHGFDVHSSWECLCAYWDSDLKHTRMYPGHEGAVFCLHALPPEALQSSQRSYLDRFATEIVSPKPSLNS